MKKLGPNYCAEIIQVIPYEGNENIRDRINAILLNIKDYVGIPYYSERTKKWYELYSSAEITNAKVNGNETIIDCILEMSLFGKFKSLITIEENPDYYFYSLKNMENLIYHHKFTAVKKGNMVSCITVFRDGDNWILYGIGGVDALKVWFIEDRVETSFINRIKTFCNFIIIGIYIIGNLIFAFPKPHDYTFLFFLLVKHCNFILQKLYIARNFFQVFFWKRL